MAVESDEQLRARLPNQMGRFIGVGAVNTVLTFALYQVLLLLLMPYWLAYTLSFAAGIVFAALVNARFVFDIGLGLGNAFRFALFYLASYVLGLVLLSLFVSELGISAAFAAFLVIPFMLPINFFGSRLALAERGGSDGLSNQRGH